MHTKHIRLYEILAETYRKKISAVLHFGSITMNEQYQVKLCYFPDWQKVNKLLGLILFKNKKHNRRRVFGLMEARRHRAIGKDEKIDAQGDAVKGI